MKKNFIIIGVFSIIVLMVLSSTMVPVVNSEPVINSKKQILNVESKCLLLLITVILIINIVKKVLDIADKIIQLIKSIEEIIPIIGAITSFFDYIKNDFWPTLQNGGNWFKEKLDETWMWLQNVTSVFPDIADFILAIISIPFALIERFIGIIERVTIIIEKILALIS